MTLFRLVRIVALATVLIIVAASTWLTERRIANWERPVWVTFYPLAGDPDDETGRYVNRIDEQSYEQINDFFQSESGKFGIDLTPVIHVQVAPVSDHLPPEIPDRNLPHKVAWWSLKMRWYAWRMGRNDGLINPDIQVFAVYHAGSDDGEGHMSVGMRKGMFGLVNLFAEDNMNARNQVVIAHELMHVFGASDKYSLGNSQPIYPFGYAEPNQEPLFPQTRCEIMGGRIPTSAYESKIPRSLSSCKIGAMSAREIGFYDRLEQAH